MSNLIPSSTFFDDGRNKREKENFQGYIFRGIDMGERSVPISFVRSDFRGAKIEEMIFQGNNFSNSDFIDSSIVKTTFNDCQFKYAELYNSYFERSTFSNALFNSASLVKLIYQDCKFHNSKFEVNTFRECKFSNCEIYDSEFSRNSMDDVEFEYTSFSNIDLSNMTAINLYFDNCKFNDVVIDADYLGSYFFKGNFLNNLKLKYRGKVFKLDINQSDLLNNLFKIFFEKERFYEAINIVVQNNLLENKQNSIYPLLQTVTDRLLTEKSQLKRSYQFDKIFKLLEYYINTGYVSISDYFNILTYFEGLNITHFDFIEQINFIEKINRLKIIIDKTDLSYSFIESSDSRTMVLLEIKIDEKDQLEFETYFDKSINSLAAYFPIEKLPYEIIAKRKGSLIYEILIYSGIALLFLKMLKSIVKTTREVLHESLNLAIDYSSDKKVLAVAKRIKGKNQIEQAKDIKEYQILSKKALEKNKDDDIAHDVTPLLPLLKSVVIYPNALTDGK